MNLHYLHRYNKFIEYCQNRILSTNDYTEKHHIIPVSLGGNNDVSNLIILSTREHYIAHWILSKAYGGNMYYAFWMMNTDIRNKSYRYKNSRGYAISRKYIIEKMSQKFVNHMTAYNILTKKNEFISTDIFNNNKEIYVACTKGKANYILNGKTVNLRTDDPLVISGEAVSIRCGYKHKSETIEKMKKHSNKGKICIYKDDKFCYINKHIEIPDGWSTECPECIKSQCKEHNKQTFSIYRWITDGVNNKRINIKTSEIPSEWKLGRTIEQRICEYCGKSVDIGNYSKHHGEKCKWKH